MALWLLLPVSVVLDHIFVFSLFYFDLPGGNALSKNSICSALFKQL